MKRFIPVTFAASLVVLAACEQPATSPATMAAADMQSSARAVHRVSAGGADIIEPGLDANWSLVAFQYADGSVKGQWVDQFGHGNGGVHIEVSCLNVVGNEAWVSGVAKGGRYDGTVWIAHMRDNGRSANEPEDDISYSILTRPGTPADVCRNPFPIALIPRSGGQVTID